MSLALTLFTRAFARGPCSLTNLMLDYFECDAVHVLDGRVFVVKDAKLDTPTNVNDFSFRIELDEMAIHLFLKQSGL